MADTGGLREIIPPDERVGLRFNGGDPERVFHISRASAYTRVERLVSEGVITGYTASIDPERYGFGISAYVYDVVTQRLSGQHYHFIDGRVETSPTEMRYAWPAELDLMARLAGMRLEHRWAGWGAEPFTALSPAHVSVYRTP